MRVDSGYSGHTILPRSVGGQRKPLGNNPLGRVVENRNHYRHHSPEESEECVWGKRNQYRDHCSEKCFWATQTIVGTISSGECLWKTGTIIDTTPLRSVFGQREPF